VEFLTGSVGWIEVICGPMFSGKSEELIRRLRRATIARKRVQVFKPAIHTRIAAVFPRPAFLALVMLLAAGSGCRPRTEVHRPSRDEARRISQEVIKQALLSPGYILFSNDAEMSIDELGRGRFRVRGFVDYQGQAGMPIRTNYTCVLRYSTRGRWEVEDLQWE